LSEVILKTGNQNIPVGHLSGVRILRGPEYEADPCPAIQNIAAESYGSSTALPVSLLQSWYNRNPAIFRIALTSKSAIIGYISSLPLIGNMFKRTIEPDFQESSISQDDIDTRFFPAKGGLFISSIAVAQDYQQQSPASLLLRLALIEDLIGQCPSDKQVVRISAQALSPKGEACMSSLGMRAHGYTDAGWKVYHGALGQTDLINIQQELQRKIKTRSKPV
jgi:hypothetical protein